MAAAVHAVTAAADEGGELFSIISAAFSTFQGLKAFPPFRTRHLPPEPAGLIARAGAEVASTAIAAFALLITDTMTDPAVHSLTSFFTALPSLSDDRILIFIAAATDVVAPPALPVTFSHGGTEIMAMGADSIVCATAAANTDTV